MTNLHFSNKLQMFYSCQLSHQTWLQIPLRAVTFLLQTNVLSVCQSAPMASIGTIPSWAPYVPEPVLELLAPWSNYPVQRNLYQCYLQSFNFLFPSWYYCLTLFKTKFTVVERKLSDRIHNRSNAEICISSLQSHYNKLIITLLSDLDVCSNRCLLHLAITA